MASSNNCNNHVGRIYESMQGVQRILFVGLDFDISKYPVLASIPWKCIYTTNKSLALAGSFSQSDRQVRPVYTKIDYDAAATILDRTNPLLIYLNGISERADEDEIEDVELEMEHDYNTKALRQTLASLLKADLLVELTIVGYNPFNTNDILPRELSTLMWTLTDNRVYFYGLNEEQKSNKYIKSLVEKGIATVFPQNLGEELEAYSSNHRVAIDDTRDVILDTTDLKYSVYINNRIIRLDQNLCYDFNKYGRILTLQEMATGTISSMMQVEYFYQFLKRSPNSPQWYGFAKRNDFAVKREFEQELYSNVIENIENNRERPIILAGQTSSGKSVALASLAYRIYQERKYPVLYINNPDVLFTSDSPASIALDNLLLEMKNHGGSVLVILDWSVYNLQRNLIVDSLSRYYNNRGHKVLFVASAMYADNKATNYRVVQAPISLTENEKNAFRELVIRKGKLPRNKVERWMKDNSYTNGLLSMLYRLVYDLHPQLERGMKIEITKALDDTREGLKEIGEPIPMPQELTSLAKQLLKMGYSMPQKTNGDDNVLTQIINSLQPFCESLAVASLFKLRMPMTMAMRLLNIPECKNRQQYRDIVLCAPWINYAMDDDRFAPGEYYVEFRDPMDARIYLESVSKSKTDQMQIVAQIIRTIIGKNESFYSDEIRFLEKLIRMIGPNSDDYKVKENWFYDYGPGCSSIIDALAALREEGIIEPQLVAQEITYIREYYGNVLQPSPQESIIWLEKAIRIARDVLDLSAQPNVNTSNWQQGLIDSITVESVFAELQLEKCYGRAKELGMPLQNTDVQLLYSYSQRSHLLLDIIENQPENSYAYTALLSCFVSEYEGKSGSIQMFTDMADVLGIVDKTASSVPRVEYNEHYQKQKDSFLSLFDQVCGGTRADHYFEELLNMGSPVGVYMRASVMMRRHRLNYNTPLTSNTRSICEKILNLLEDKKHALVVSNHAASQYMRLQLTWLYYNGNPVFAKQRQTTKMTESNWRSLLKICDEFKYNIIDQHPECTYIATVYYIMGLAYAQLEQYKEANDIWQLVHEDDFYTLGRSYTWHVLSTPTGEPKLFNGTFNWILQENKLYIKEMHQQVYYRSLQSINKSDRNGEAANLCIGTSYRGFSTFALNWKLRRDD